jgi:hypothetical protein
MSSCHAPPQHSDQPAPHLPFARDCRPVSKGLGRVAAQADAMTAFVEQMHVDRPLRRAHWSTGTVRSWTEWNRIIGGVVDATILSSE